MNDPFEKQNRELIDRLIEGIASDEEFARANALLGSSPKARREFLDKRYLVSALEGERGAPAQAGAVASDLVLPRRGRLRRFAPVAVAVSIVVGITGFWLMSRRDRPAGPPIVQANTIADGATHAVEPVGAARGESFLAKLVVSDAARFDGPLQPRDGAFSKGAYSLAEGAVSLRFINGVELTLESPAEFELIHAKLVVLHGGKARARVPPTGIGFVIAAPDVDIEDLGTEFGILVEEGRTAALRVFTGAVELKRQGHEPLRLEEDAVTGLQSGELLAAQDVGNVRFPTSVDLSFRRWKAFSERLRNDPSLILYYDFEKDPEQPGVLRDRSTTHPPLDGVIRNSHWLSGRWPNKGALLFENTGDCVELDLPGSYEAFTQAVWLRATRLEVRQAILSAHGWRPGKHHLALYNTGGNTGQVGALMSGIVNKLDWRNQRDHSFGSVSVGQWLHMAAVVDRQRGSATYYLNGEEIGRKPVVLKVPFAFGRTLIGAFAQYAEDEWPYDRQYHGWIDEVAMFGRVLSADEVRALYVNGRCCD